MIKFIEIKNFRLLKDCAINFGQINLIDGINLDVEGEETANASGKSTVLQAIQFCITGDIYKLTQKQIVSRGKKSTSVTIQAEENNHLYEITRSIPTDLSISIDGEDYKANTPTLKQPEIDKLYGDKKFIQQFRSMDKNKDTDLLAMGSVSIRKILMGFADDLFTEARTKLLAELNHRELYSYTKRPYHFYLSNKRLQILKDGLTNLKQIDSTANQTYYCQQDLVQSIKTNISKKELEEKQLQTNIKNNDNSIIKHKTNISEYETKINSIDLTDIKLPEQIDYLSDIANKDAQLLDIEDKIKLTQAEYDGTYSIFEDLRQQQTDLEHEINELHNKIADSEDEIATITKAVSGQKCDKCGSLVTEENKNIYIADQQKLIKEYNEQKIKHESNLLDINKKLLDFEDTLNKLKTQIQTYNLQINEIRKEIKTLNNDNLAQEKLINELSQQGTKKTSEIEKYKSLIASLNDTINTLTASNIEFKKQLETLPKELLELKEQLEIEEELFSEQQKYHTTIQNKIKLTESYIMKLEEAFKFSEYKFTERDIFEYKEAIKLLDSFAAFYVLEFLQNLEVIINSLLSVVNMSIKFTTDKSFLTIKDGEEEFEYCELSGGQQAFLNCICKLGILMTQGINFGVIILDESLDVLAEKNFYKLLEIFKTTKFQYFIVKQGFGKNIEIDGINIINLIRKDGATSLSK